MGTNHPYCCADQGAKATTGLATFVVTMLKFTNLRVTGMI